jgi:formate dehydrogenase subunit delta
MSDTRSRLVYMANQIARNFAAMGIDAEAATAEHIASFWDPAMRAVLIADPAGLNESASAAFDRLRSASAAARVPKTEVMGRSKAPGGSDAG